MFIFIFTGIPEQVPVKVNILLDILPEIRIPVEYAIIPPEFHLDFL